MDDVNGQDGPDAHRRRSIRLRGYDYAEAGAYYVTVCVRGREWLFGRITDKATALSPAGEMAKAVLGSLPVRFPHVIIDTSVIMPNHVHAIIVIKRGEHKVRPYGIDSVDGDDCRGEPCVRPEPYMANNAKGTLPQTLGRMIQAFKSITTHQYIQGVQHHHWPPFPGKLWQRGFYDRIVRDEDDLYCIRDYVATNPARWIARIEERL